MSARTGVMLALFLVLAACDTPSNPVTAPSTLTLTTELFRGTLSVGGSRFFSFRVTESGTVAFTLASVTSPITGAALTLALGVGAGIPAGTDCGVSQSIITPATLQTQLSRSLTPGIYCVRVWDIGTLTNDVDFAIRFTHP